MMRLAPVSNLCSCWKIAPRRLARSAWLSPNSSRRSRMRLPTWPTISTSRGWRRLVLADFDDGHWLAIIDARLGLLEQIEQTKADALDRRRVDARHDVQRAKLGPGIFSLSPRVVAPAVHLVSPALFLASPALDDRVREIEGAADGDGGQQHSVPEYSLGIRPETGEKFTPPRVNGLTRDGEIRYVSIWTHLGASGQFCRPPNWVFERRCRSNLNVACES